MHRKAASGELLAAYKRLSLDNDAAVSRIHNLLKLQATKRWTDAEIGRLWKNSPEVWQDADGLPAFHRIVRLVEDAHDITES